MQNLHATCTLCVLSAMCTRKCSDLIVQCPKVLCSNALCSKVLCSKVQPICQTRPNNKGLCRLSQPPSCCSGGKRGDGRGGIQIYNYLAKSHLWGVMYDTVYFNDIMYYIQSDRAGTSGIKIFTIFFTRYSTVKNSFFSHSDKK